MVRPAGFEPATGGLKVPYSDLAELRTHMVAEAGVKPTLGPMEPRTTIAYGGAFSAIPIAF